MSTVSETERTPDPGNNVFLGAINDDSDSDDPWAIALTLDGKPVTLQIDTGADVTLLPTRERRGGESSGHR